MLENITTFLTENNELAWIAIFLFAFMESFILSFMVSSLILFYICVFAYNEDMLDFKVIVFFVISFCLESPISIFFSTLFFGKNCLNWN